MPSRYLVAPALVLFWLLVGAAFVWAGQRQSERVNLSAAAGGQYPYLTYAWRIAESGLGEWRGDRNRMPLYPLLLSTVGDGDWNTFVERSTSFAITSSAAALAVIGVLSYWGLSVWPATVLTLAAAVCIFIYKASFVQAELLYYALFYAAWLVLCRLLHGPSVLWGLAGGLCVGLAYLTKASGMAILLPYLAAAGVQIVALLFARRPAVLADLAAQDRRRCLAVLRSAVIAGLGFLVVVYPYISSNKSRFGRYFYNVNTSFFMWCDSWPEAKSFADKYQITDHYPDAPPDAVPGPLAYWRQHTMGRIAHRLGYGVITLASIAADQPIFKYLVATLAFCVFFGMKEKRRLRELWSEYWCTALFCVLGFGGYLAVFAWYAVVAYGGRFVLSLLLPAMFVLLWLCERIGQVARPVLLLGYRVRKSTAFWIIMLVFLLGEGAVTATTTLYEPGKEFVQFYYNESRELLEAGNLEEAEKGVMGVLQLDPKFAPAHHELGMIALQTNRIDGAVASLTIAKSLDPQVADTRNSLGSALVQAGRPQEAIAEFRKATELDPAFATAWYNLGGTYCLVGATDEARLAQQKLEALDPELARQLGAVIAGSRGTERRPGS